MNINTIREMVGHADERTTMNSYCYDRRTEDERRAILERALSSKE
jgi:integrase